MVNQVQRGRSKPVPRAVHRLRETQGQQQNQAQEQCHTMKSSTPSSSQGESRTAANGELGGIEKINSPTEWCAGLVVVPKSDGRVQMCVDLTKLNTNVCRERLMHPTVEYILAQIGDAKYFLKLDANSSFWRVELNPESCELTTFITPVGRYCFDHLPFGITSGPEHFQQRMSGMLQGMDGVVCLIIDITVLPWI